MFDTDYFIVVLLFFFFFASNASISAKQATRYPDPEPTSSTLLPSVSSSPPSNSRSAPILNTSRAYAARLSSRSTRYQPGGLDTPPLRASQHVPFLSTLLIFSTLSRVLINRFASSASINGRSSSCRANANSFLLLLLRRPLSLSKEKES